MINFDFDSFNLGIVAAVIGEMIILQSVEVFKLFRPNRKGLPNIGRKIPRIPRPTCNGGKMIEWPRQN